MTGDSALNPTVGAAVDPVVDPTVDPVVDAATERAWQRQVLRWLVCLGLGLAMSGGLFYAVVALNRTAAAKPLEEVSDTTLLRVSLPPPAEPEPKPDKPPPEQRSAVRSASQPSPAAEPLDLQLDIDLPGLDSLALPQPAAAPAVAATAAEPLPKPRVFQASEVDQQATPLSPMLPPYPEAAKRRGLEGVVRLKLLVDEGGAVRRVQVLGGPPLLAQSSSEYALRIAFAPAHKSGKPVKQWVILPLKFRLR